MTPAASDEILVREGTARNEVIFYLLLYFQDKWFSLTLDRERLSF